VEVTARSAGRGSSESPVPVELLLERNVGAPGAARRAVMGLCGEHGIDGKVQQTLLLLVSEIVSNAVLHSTGPADASVKLTAAVSPRTIRISVTDAGEGFCPAPRDPSRTDGGYGLFLLERAAQSWGVESEGPTSVWFELAREQ
jgi:anti-sigma regulatory factor (Ser/Thr protein kinase)